MTQIAITITSISINGRITLNMHSLNNEGNEGNQVLTRQVTIIDQSGKPATVTAVSGDMLKHITNEHFWLIAKNENLELSETSKVFNSNRILKKDLKEQNASNDESYNDAIIKTCALSDVAGAMITEKNNISRKSIIEYGWLLALPEANETDSYFHAKFVSDAKAKKSDTNKNDSSGSGNEGQNIFHRPANSGIYAFVGNLDINRLSYNDISKKYPIEKEKRKKRYQALLKSVLYTFLKPNGAMRNTQNPHISNFEGVVSFSKTSCPAPTVSPLKDGYKDEIEKTVNFLNQIEENSIETRKFNSISEFTEIFTELIQAEPGSIKVDDNEEETGSK